MTDERERIEVWPTFVVIGACAVVIAGVMLGAQAGASMPSAGVMLLGWLIGALGWPLLLAGLIGAAVNGYRPKSPARAASAGAAPAENDLAALTELETWDDRAQALRELRRRRDAGDITTDEYERARTAIQGD